MRTILRLIGGILIGIVVGFAIAAVIIILSTDMPFTEYIGNVQSADMLETISAVLVGVMSLLISIAVLIPVHEAGHLVCGLLTGYGFVSFRIFNLTLIKINGRIKVKKFAVAGTGGQCLLNPPDLPFEMIPTGWYNAGGVLANILILLLVLPLFFLNLHPFMVEALVIFCLTDVFLILTNGIPLKLNGISNDGYNILYLNRNPLSKQALVMQLRSNTLIQNGIRPKDMPDEWFVWRTDIDFRNPLEVSIPFMHASWLIDLELWGDAYLELLELYGHRNEIMKLYVDEIACELAFCALATGRNEHAVDLLDPKLRKYIDTYKNVMSSKQRLTFAIALYIDGDRNKAVDIYRKLCRDRGKYLLQGEVESDLAIMDSMLR